MGLGRVEDAWTKFCCKAGVLKVSRKWERCILGFYGFGKGL